MPVQSEECLGLVSSIGGFHLVAEATNLIFPSPVERTRVGGVLSLYGEDLKSVILYPSG